MTIDEECASKSDLLNSLSLKMRLLHNCRSLVYTYFSMINGTVLENQGQHAGASITLS